MNEQVFISYRREGGDITAKLICESLKNSGYTVFYDYDSLSGGYFDDRILDAIENCTDFVLVLPKNSLDRCVNENDWVRKEIAYAMQHHKNIVPIAHPDFVFPTNLPDDIKDISRINAISFVMAYFEGVMDLLKDRLFSKPSIVNNPAVKEIFSEGLKYTLDEKLNGYSVSMGTCNDSRINIPQSYNGKAVVAVAEDGFRDCSAIKSVTLPETITNIGKNAFYKCTILESINIPSRVREIGGWAFYKCTSLKEFKLPRSLKTVGKRAFTDCNSLLEFKVEDGNAFYRDCGKHLFTSDMKSLVSYAGGNKETIYAVPVGVTTIIDCAFSQCYSLVEVILPETVEYIEDYAFYECTNLISINLPKHITSLGEYSFSKCASLESIAIPNGVTKIGEDAFRDCPSLKTVTLPDSVKIIAKSAFNTCKKLENVNFPESLLEIDKWAFYGCSNLERVFIPKNVELIGDRAFADCGALREFKVDAENDFYCDRDRVLYSKDMKTLVQYPCGCRASSYTIQNGVETVGDSSFSQGAFLTKVTFPNTVEYIKKYAFADCKAMETIALPETLKGIDAFAFRDCASLTSVVIPCGVEAIEEDTFRRCYALKNVVLPDTVKKLEKGAFNDCTSLESINIPSKVTEIGDWAFFDCAHLKNIKLPKTLKTIGKRAFSGCEAVEKMTVSFFNRTYKCVGNAVYTKDMKTLVTYIRGRKEKEFVVPNGVSLIEDSAFTKATIESITIPSSVTEIGEFAFSNCSSLKTINYRGTTEMFKNVNKKGNCFNKVKNKEVNCTDGIVKV